MPDYKEMSGFVGDALDLQFGEHVLQYTDAKDAISKNGNAMAELEVTVITEGSVDYGVTFREWAAVTPKAMWKWHDIWWAVSGEQSSEDDRKAGVLPEKLQAIIQQLEDAKAKRPPSETDYLRLLLNRPFKAMVYGEMYTSTNPHRPSAPPREKMGIRITDMHPLDTPQTAPTAPSGPTQLPSEGLTAPTPTDTPPSASTEVKDEDIPF